MSCSSNDGDGPGYQELSTSQPLHNTLASNWGNNTRSTQPRTPSARTPSTKTPATVSHPACSCIWGACIMQQHLVDHRYRKPKLYSVCRDQSGLMEFACCSWLHEGLSGKCNPIPVVSDSRMPALAVLMSCLLLTSHCIQVPVLCMQVEATLRQLKQQTACIWYLFTVNISVKHTHCWP